MVHTIICILFVFVFILSTYAIPEAPLPALRAIDGQVAMKLKRKEWRPGQEIVKQGDVGAVSSQRLHHPLAVMGFAMK